MHTPLCAALSGVGLGVGLGLGGWGMDVDGRAGLCDVLGAGAARACDESDLSQRAMSARKARRKHTQFFPTYVLRHKNPPPTMIECRERRAEVVASIERQKTKQQFSEQCSGWERHNSHIAGTAAGEALQRQRPNKNNNNIIMSAQHWQSFVSSSSPRFDAASLPIDAAEYRRQRRKQECSWKSLFCCLKILVGKPPRTNNTADVRRRQAQVALLRSNNTDDSFGYNFDEHPPPPQLSSSSERSEHTVD